jgi:hypothetical protein
MRVPRQRTVSPAHSAVAHSAVAHSVVCAGVRGQGVKAASFTNMTEWTYVVAQVAAVAAAAVSVNAVAATPWPFAALYLMGAALASPFVLRATKQNERRQVCTVAFSALAQMCFSIAYPQGGDSVSAMGVAFLMGLLTPEVETLMTGHRAAHTTSNAVAERKDALRDHDTCFFVGAAFAAAAVVLDGAVYVVILTTVVLCFALAGYAYAQGKGPSGMDVAEQEDLRQRAEQVLATIDVRSDEHLSVAGSDDGSDDSNGSIHLPVMEVPDIVTDAPAGAAGPAPGRLELARGALQFAASLAIVVSGASLGADAVDHGYSAAVAFGLLLGGVSGVSLAGHCVRQPERRDREPGVFMFTVLVLSLVAVFMNAGYTPRLLLVTFALWGHGLLTAAPYWLGEALAARLGCDGTRARALDSVVLARRAGGLFGCAAGLLYWHVGACVAYGGALVFLLVATLVARRLRTR